MISALALILVVLEGQVASEDFPLRESLAAQSESYQFRLSNLAYRAIVEYHPRWSDPTRRDRGITKEIRSVKVLNDRSFCHTTTFVGDRNRDEHEISRLNNGDTYMTYAPHKREAIIWEEEDSADTLSRASVYSILWISPSSYYQHRFREWRSPLHELLRNNDIEASAVRVDDSEYGENIVLLTTPGRTVWIDTARNGIIMRSINYVDREHRIKRFESVIEEVHELNGVYFPARLKTTHYRLDAAGIDIDGEQELAMVSIVTYPREFLRIGELSEEDFVIDLPIGTQVLDKRAQFRYTVGGDDPD